SVQLISRGGTQSSNPVRSSGESGANLSLAGIRLPTSRSRGFPRVWAARLAARSAETRRVEQYRTKERQCLCRPLFQYRRAAGAVSGPWRGWVAGKRVGRGGPVLVWRWARVGVTGSRARWAAPARERAGGSGDTA